MTQRQDLIDEGAEGDAVGVVVAEIRVARLHARVVRALNLLGRRIARLEKGGGEGEGEGEGEREREGEREGKGEGEGEGEESDLRSPAVELPPSGLPPNALRKAVLPTTEGDALRSEGLSTWQDCRHVASGPTPDGRVVVAMVPGDFFESERKDSYTRRRGSRRASATSSES
ncbi:unnamed protein product [Closterium sp. NIES-53]